MCGVSEFGFESLDLRSVLLAPASQPKRLRRLEKLRPFQLCIRVGSNPVQNPKSRIQNPTAVTFLRGGAFCTSNDDAPITAGHPGTPVSFLYGQAQRRFEASVQTYQHRIYGFAVYFLGDRVEAQDVTQEVFLRLWQHRNDVDEARLLGWLLRVTRNACVDALRRRKARTNVMRPDTDALGLAPGDGPMPDACAEAADFQEHLERALARLDEPYRSIVILREIQELKYEEISGALDLPLNTVKVYLHRGRKMLRKHLSEVMHRETV